MTDAFNDIPAFVAAVEAGGFSAAARNLNLSRSTIGKAIRRLELRLGVRLFHRTTRSHNLTEDGQAFYERCQRAVGELQAGQAQLESGRKTVSGRLRVSVPVLFGRICVAPVLMQLAALHPELELELNFSDRPTDLIEDGFDLAVRTGPLDGSSGLMARFIVPERTMVFASPGYLEAHGAPQKLGDLADHQAITYGRNGRLQVWRFPDQGELSPPTRCRFDDLGAIADAAAAGYGLAWLPYWLVRDRVRSGELKPVLADHPPYISDIHAVWPETPHLPMRVRVAIDALVAGVPALSRA